MKHLLAVVLLAASCASAQPLTEQPLPQCLSYCNNNFAACTQEHPGDYGACDQELNSCKEECAAQKAMERMEDNSQEEEVVAPTDAPPPEAVPEVPTVPGRDPEAVEPDSELR